MPERLFPFLQVELSLELGPPDGRWMLRSPLDGQVDRVIVLSTVGGRRADEGKRHRRSRARRAEHPETAQASVAVTRATVITPREAFETQARAEAWLSSLNPDVETAKAFAAIAQLAQADRIAAAKPWLADPSPTQALAVRAGFGQGEQVADGRWLRAVELPTRAQETRRGRRRAAMLGAGREERLAALLSGREQPLICEELALRARRDLDGCRPQLAAIELERAYAAAAAELAMSPRIAELHGLRDAVRAAAADAMPATSTGSAESDVDVEQTRHALERLEAALRARALPGSSVSSGAHGGLEHSSEPGTEMNGPPGVPPHAPEL